MCSDEDPSYLVLTVSSQCPAVFSDSPICSLQERRLVEAFLGLHYLKNIIYFFLCLNLKLSYNFDSALCTLHMCGVLANAEAVCEFQKRQAHGKRGEGWERAQPPREGLSQPPASHLRCPRVIESIFLQSRERLTQCCKQMRACAGRKLRNGVPGGD